MVEVNEKMPSGVYVRTEEHNKHNSESHKGRKISEEAKKHMSEGQLGRKHTEETKQKMRDNHPHLSGEDAPMYGRTGEKCPMFGVHRYGEDAPNYGHKHTDESKQKKGKSVSGEKNGMYGRHLTKEAKQHLSEIHIGKHHTEEAKQKMRGSRPKSSGENHPNWDGGLSYEPYYIKFNGEFKERVRDFFGRICFICGKSEMNNGRKLDVHHVNYLKMACCDPYIRPMFVPLCRSCHSLTNFERESWEEFLTASLEYLTNGECFLSKKGEKRNE